jgi:DNA-binding response OmpR family regulator
MASMRRRPLVMLVADLDDYGLAPVMERCGFSVVESGSPEAALFEFGQHAFDAVVAVLPLSGMGAVALCREVRLRGRTPVLVVTCEKDADWLEAFGAGADDHVRIFCDERELQARLHALIRRFRGSLSPQLSVAVGDLVIHVGGEVVAVEPPVPLTAVQATLLGHLARHPGVALSEAALSERVGSVHGHSSDIQLDTELRNLRTAVAAASGVPDAVENLEGVGWRLAST